MVGSRGPYREIEGQIVIAWKLEMKLVGTEIEIVEKYCTVGVLVRGLRVAYDVVSQNSLVVLRYPESHLP